MTDYAAMTPEQYAAHVNKERRNLGFPELADLDAFLAPLPVVLELPPRERVGLS